MITVYIGTLINYVNNKCVIIQKNVGYIIIKMYSDEIKCLIYLMY